MLTGQNYKLQIIVVQCPGSNKAACRQFVGIKEKDNLSLGQKYPTLPPPPPSTPEGGPGLE